MKPRLLNRTLECDDGNFNVRWTEDGREERTCEWKVLGGAGEACGKVSKADEQGFTNYWCIECGLVVCRTHRKRHADSPQHQQRIDKWREQGIDIPVLASSAGRIRDGD